MADISRYLQAILDAVYGEEVRGSIHDAIEVINDVSEVILTTGTVIDSASSSSTGFFTNSLYLNTDTYELWKCIGVDTWQSQGILKGPKGEDGEDGADGNKWYRGTGISGKAQNPTVYSGSGITDANVNDNYLNPNEGAVYHCVTGGDANTATWIYDFTMTGGGGGTSDYPDLTNKPQINGVTLSGNQTSAQLGLMGTGAVAWLQIQPSTGATKIATITIEGVTYDVYAPTGGGGGASSLDDLSDVGIDTLTLANGQVLVYNSTTHEFENVDMPQGGHDMIPIYDSQTGLTDLETIEALNSGTAEKVANAYSIKRWSNCDAKIILTTASQNADGIGTWEDDATWETGSRSGWLWSADFYRILEDGDGNRVIDTEIIPVFDIGDSETVGLLSYRIDDNVSYNGTPGGAVAFKFTGAIQSASGVKVGLKLVHQRTEYNDTGTRLT